MTPDLEADSLHLRIRDLARSPLARFIHQTLQSRSSKSFPPLTYGLIGHVQLPSDLPVFETIGATQHNTARSSRVAVLGRGAPIAEACLFLPQSVRLAWLDDPCWLGFPAYQSGCKYLC